MPEFATAFNRIFRKDTTPVPKQEPPQRAGEVIPFPVERMSKSPIERGLYQMQEENWGQDWEMGLDTPEGVLFLHTEKGHPINEDAIGAKKTKRGMRLVLCDATSTQGKQTRLADMERPKKRVERNRQELAAYQVSHTVVNELMNAPDSDLTMDSIAKANAEIGDGSTTLSVVEIVQDKLISYSVGNSRVKVYRLNKSEYQLVFTNKPATREQAKIEKDPHYGQKVDCLGKKSHPTIQIETFLLQKGDIIVMEGDGISDKDADTVPVSMIEPASKSAKPEYAVDYTAANARTSEQKRCQILNEANSDPAAITGNILQEARKIPNNFDDKSVVVWRCDALRIEDLESDILDADTVLYYEQGLANAQAHAADIIEKYKLEMAEAFQDKAQFNTSVERQHEHGEV